MKKIDIIKNLYKRYYAELDKPAEKEDIALFAAGMEFADFTAKPAKLEITENPSEVFVSISEGKYHQIRRLVIYNKNTVISLKRIRIGKYNLSNLQENELKQFNLGDD